MNQPHTTRTAVPVDHVIFYAGFRLGELASWFERLGFTLTPLGRHNSGSVNRLAMLDGQYLELMGFEEGTPSTVRPELQAMPLGLNGIVAADQPQHVRTAAPEAFLPPVHLERPVATAEAQGVASFTITNVRRQAPDVRVFLCRHHTPELVWQPQWQQHANRAVAVTHLRISTQHPELLHGGLRTVFDIQGGGAAAAYDAAGTTVEVVPPGERSSVTVRTRDLASTMAILRAARVPYTLEARRVVVALPEPYAADLIFAAAP
jgi:hypothetical protein